MTRSTIAAHWIESAPLFEWSGRPLCQRRGRIKEIKGSVLLCSGIDVAVGQVCLLQDDGGLECEAEVIALTADGSVLMPYADVSGLGSSTRVIPTGHLPNFPVSDRYLGRVVDPLGRPLDAKPTLQVPQGRAQVADVPSPMSRRRIKEIFHTGVRAIDALCTVGIGQRVGIFAPAGVGKSVLLGMLARNCDSDVNVIALIGERGREVREFVEDSLGPAGLARSAVIVATADTSPLERARAAHAATSLASYYRAQGNNVLLLMDSVTRFARAQREIGLARGEPPTRRGFPSSLFTVLPQLFERAGADDRGSVTAFYTVLMEDDMTPDPVAEEVRSLLDGHLVLSRKLAGRGIYPAVDVTASLSRVMRSIVRPNQYQAANVVRDLLARCVDVELLVQAGEYERGHDAATDNALDRQDKIWRLICQSPDDTTDFEDSIGWLAEATGVNVS